MPLAAAQTATSTTVSASVNAAVWCQPVTLTATVTPGGTGTVTFHYHPQFVGQVAQLVGNQAHYTVECLPVGADQITAVYSGDGNFAPSVSSVLTLLVSPATETIALTLPLPGQTFDPGQPVALSVVVTVQPPSLLFYTGTVEFLDNNIVIGSTLTLYYLTPTSYRASITVTNLASGLHSLTARFTGYEFDGYSLDATTTSGLPVPVTVRKATSTALTVSAHPAVWTQSVTLTATVTAGATGTVTFYLFFTALGPPVAIIGNQAQLTSQTLPAGNLPITANYSGDAAFGTSTSSPVNLQVNPANSATAITQPTPNASWTAGQATIIQANVSVLPPASAWASGTVEFLDNGVVFTSSTVLSGGVSGANVATASMAGLAPGAHLLTARFVSNKDINGNLPIASSTSPAMPATVKRASSTVLTAGVNAPRWGQPVTLTAVVTPGATGIVTLFDPVSFPSGIWGTLTGGQAQVTASNLRLGAHSITATYSGDAIYGGSQSIAISLLVSPARTVTTLLSPSPGDGLVVGQPVTLSARVQPEIAGATAPGSVQFLDGGNALGLTALSGGVASLAQASLAAGAHYFSASYFPAPDADGNVNFAASASDPVVMAGGKRATSLSLGSAPASTAYGQTVTLTISLGPAPPPGVAAPGGQVTFQEAGVTYGAALVAGGTAALSIQSLSEGTHSITAVYSGDTLWLSATATATVTVNRAATTTSLSSSINAAGQAVLTARVLPPPGVSGACTGVVHFTDTVDGSALGTALLASGSASQTVSPNLAMHSMAAVYAGDKNFLASTSAATPAVVNAASYGSSGIAPDSLSAMFNMDLPDGEFTAAQPLPTSLGGVSVTIADRAGASLPAQIFGVFASSRQINFVLPGGTAPGLATLTVAYATGNSLSTVINVAPVAPGILTANASGKGVAAASFLRVADNGQTLEDAATYDSAQRVWIPQPVDLGAESDQVFLVLYGTGLRHAPDGDVSVSIGGVNAEVQFAGAQPMYPGLDQVNVRVPHALAGSGAVAVIVTSAGQQANTVTIAIR